MPNYTQTRRHYIRFIFLLLHVCLIFVYNCFDIRYSALYNRCRYSTIAVFFPPALYAPARGWPDNSARVPRNRTTVCNASTMADRQMRNSNRIPCTCYFCKRRGHRVRGLIPPADPILSNEHTKYSTMNILWHIICNS